MLTEKLSRVSIAHLPTPLELLPRLTAQLGGPELWIKRDDQTGLATGGNKARKLEFLVADALVQGADTLITGGAAQSNHARQTAAAAAKLGFDCTLVLRRPEPDFGELSRAVEGRGGESSQVQGNLLLDRLLEAEVVWAGERPLDTAMAHVAEDLRAAGRQPYVIPYGGSNPIGASGYVAAMEELLDQCTGRDLNFEHIVFASSSGGTQSGLALGARALDYDGRILGVSVDQPAGVLRSMLVDLATATADHLELGFSFAPEDFEVNDDYLGGGYGVVGELEREALRVAARAEGVLLDPVYTGRAFGGLLDMIRRGVFSPGERVLFWHTGGTAGLFGYGGRVL